MGKRKGKGEKRKTGVSPPRTMLSPKRRITRQRLHPSPVSSGQLTVIKIGSSGLSGGRMITASSLGTPILNSVVSTPLASNSFVSSGYACRRLSLLGRATSGVELEHQHHHQASAGATNGRGLITVLYI